MRPEEALMQRRNTSAFVEADSVIVKFKRSTKVRDERGGLRSEEPILLKSQRVKVGRSRQTKARPGEAATTAGLKTRDYDRLVGSHDLDIEEKDEFDLLGDWYRVSDILRTIYETSAVIERV